MWSPPRGSNTNEGEADPRALRLLIAATPDAETVLPWLRTLAVLAGFLTVAILPVTLELLGRI